MMGFILTPRDTTEAPFLLPSPPSFPLLICNILPLISVVFPTLLCTLSPPWHAPFLPSVTSIISPLDMHPLSPLSCPSFSSFLPSVMHSFSPSGMYTIGISCAEYARKMSRGCWGGGIEMACMSRMKGCNVHVYEKNRTGRWIITPSRFYLPVYLPPHLCTSHLFIYPFIYSPPHVLFTSPRRIQTH